MRLHPAMKNGERKVIPFRTATMSTQIVAQVREALFAKELRPGDFLYLPPGCPHVAWCDDLLSAHLTIVVDGLAQADVVSTGRRRCAPG